MFYFLILFLAPNFESCCTTDQNCQTYSKKLQIKHPISKDFFSNQLTLSLQNLDFLSQLTLFLYRKFKIENECNLNLNKKLISFGKFFSVVIKFLDKLLSEKNLLFELCKEMYVVLQNHILELSEEKLTSLRRVQMDNSIHHQSIKEMTIKGLEPQVEKLIIQHGEQINNLKSMQELESVNIRVKLRNTFDEQIIALRDKYQAELSNSNEKIKEETMSFLQKQVKRRENVLIQRRYSSVILFKQGIISIIDELCLLNSQIVAVKKNFLRESNDFICKLEKFGRKLLQETNKNRAEEKLKLNDYLQREMNTVKIHLEELYRIDSEKKEQTIIQKFKKKHDENIEILITNLEGKFNETRYSESVQQNENNYLLKINYERQLSELQLKNKRIETEYADLCAKYEKLEKYFALVKNDRVINSADLASSNIQGGESHDPENMIFLPTCEKQSITNVATVHLENKHLKNYIRELELKMKLD